MVVNCINAFAEEKKKLKEMVSDKSYFDQPFKIPISELSTAMHLLPYLMCQARKAFVPVMVKNQMSANFDLSSC